MRRGGGHFSLAIALVWVAAVRALPEHVSLQALDTQETQEADVIFDKKFIVITPVLNVTNLDRIRQSLDFNLVHRWIIIFDPKTKDELKENNRYFVDSEPAISQYLCPNVAPCSTRSCYEQGNVNRNYGLDRLAELEADSDARTQYVYFLDGDNLVHPALWKEPEVLTPAAGVLTWNLVRPPYLYPGVTPPTHGMVIMDGASCQQGHIDTAMFMVRRDLLGDRRWWVEAEANGVGADGALIQSLCMQHQLERKHLAKVLATHNALSWTVQTYMQLVHSANSSDARVLQEADAETVSQVLHPVGDERRLR